MRASIVIAIIVLLLIILLYLSNDVRIYNNTLPGMYVGCDKFLKKSGLSEMYLYISSDMKKGSLIIIDNDEYTLENCTLKLDICKPWYVSRFSKQAYYNCTFKGSIWPEKLKISYSYETGLIIIYNSKCIYGMLTKDSKSTLYAQEVLAITK
jgi:hypothetical protein